MQTSNARNILPTQKPMRRLIPEFSKYFVASALALAVDTVLLLLLARFIHYAIAATVSFTIGAIVHYFLSVGFVFAHRNFRHRRWLESAIFISLGAGALAVNLAVIAMCVEWLGLPLIVAKFAAAGASFVFGYVTRKLSLFR